MAITIEDITLEADPHDARWTLRVTRQHLNTLRSRGAHPCQNDIEMTVVSALIQAMRPRRVCEIGALRGGWIAALTDALSHNAIIWEIDPADTPALRIARRRAEHIVCAGTNRRIEWKIARSQDIAHEIRAAAPWDLVHVDGDHRYEAVRHDLELAHEVLRPGGLLVAHDVRNPKEEGLRRAWDEFAKEKDMCIIDAGAGMGIGLVWKRL